MEQNQEEKDPWVKFSEETLSKIVVGGCMRIDTRDFHGNVFGPDNGIKDLEFSTPIENCKKQPELKCYTAAEIAATVLEIKQKSGGDARWRFIDLPGVADNSGWNMKYLNIIRIDTDVYVLLTNRGSVISKDRLSKIYYDNDNIE